MEAPAREKLQVLLASLVKMCRADYLRIKDGEDYVTDAERAEARTAYQAALERLSRFLADTRSPQSVHLARSVYADNEAKRGRLPVAGRESGPFDTE